MEEQLSAVEKLVGDELKATEQSLEDYSTNLWDIVNKPRTLAYEEEADRTAAIFLALSGYDPNAIVDDIQKIESDAKNSLTKNYNQDKAISFVDFKKRKEHLIEYIQSSLASIQGKKMEQRFHKNVK